MTARLIVTGSRRWDRPDRIERVLKTIRAQDHFADAALAHGGARGVDQMAAAAWIALGGVAVPYPARWTRCVRGCPPNHLRQGSGGRRYCPTAGHRRNQRMVDAGADLALAFSRDGSSGTNDCVQRAIAAGIPVLMFEYERAVGEGVWL